VVIGATNQSATGQQSVTELRQITEFAQEQSTVLKNLFGMTDDVEFAQLSMLKLQEEAGEVAEAYLAYRRLQRADKLRHSDAELRANLGRELADVTVVVALIAEAAGLSFHEILAERIDDLMVRREAMNQLINDRLMTAWEKASALSDQPQLPLDAPGTLQ
jgi:NTP pyrophosphatase (non-canonical NTP hydrolase)